MIGVTFVLLFVIDGAWAYTDTLTDVARGRVGAFGSRTLLLAALLPRLPSVFTVKELLAEDSRLRVLLREVCGAHGFGSSIDPRKLGFFLRRMAGRRVEGRKVIQDAGIKAD